jgi:hypothetical protein
MWAPSYALQAPGLVVVLQPLKDLRLSIGIKRGYVVGYSRDIRYLMARVHAFLIICFLFPLFFIFHIETYIYCCFYCIV